MDPFALVLFRRLLSGGEPALLAQLQSPEPEDTFIDFKGVATPRTRYVEKGVLADSDKKTLGEAVSGFANSLGGVIVWGVDCRGLVGSARLLTVEHALDDAPAFKAVLASLTGSASVPGVPGILLEPLTLPSIGKAVVLMYVPRFESGPVRATTKDTDRYMFRAGDKFLAVPHDVLAAMFGRTPPPIIAPVVYSAMEEPTTAVNAMKVGFYIGLKNDGLGMAFHAFCDLVVDSPREGFSQQFDAVPEDSRFEIRGSVKERLTVVAKPNNPLPPGSAAILARAMLVLAPPFTRPLRLVATAGAEHGLPNRVEFVVEPDRLREVYEISQRGIPQREAWQALFPE